MAEEDTLIQDDGVPPGWLPHIEKMNVIDPDLLDVPSDPDDDLELLADEWNEEDHPRDPNGQFGELAGGTYSGSHAREGMQKAGLVRDNPLPRSKNLDFNELEKHPFDFSAPHDVETVEVASLKTVQDYVVPDQVGLYMMQKSDRPSGMELGPLSVIEIGKEKIVINGTHRLLAAHFNGEKNIAIHNYGKYTKSSDGKLSRDITNDQVSLTHAYRAVRGGEVKVGQIFRDPNEAKLARDVSSVDAGEGSQLWEVDISDIEEAEADAVSVYLPPGTSFAVVGFDAERGIWEVDAQK